MIHVSTKKLSKVDFQFFKPDHFQQTKTLFDFIWANVIMTPQWRNVINKELMLIKNQMQTK